MTLVCKTFDLYGKTYTFEVGRARQAGHRRRLVKQGDSTVLDHRSSFPKERKNYDFFPLTVDFNEKMYAAGRIRAATSSVRAVLTRRPPSPLA